MTQTTARIKKAGKNFEIMVDLEKAVKFRKGETKTVDFLEIDKVFSDSKKGFAASEADMKSSFGTDDVYEIELVNGSFGSDSSSHQPENPPSVEVFKRV